MIAADTGNHPASEANAQFIASAGNFYIAALEEIEQLQARLKPLRPLLKLLDAINQIKEVIRG